MLSECLDVAEKFFDVYDSLRLKKLAAYPPQPPTTEAARCQANVATIQAELNSLYSFQKKYLSQCAANYSSSCMLDITQVILNISEITVHLP